MTVCCTASAARLGFSALVVIAVFGCATTPPAGGSKAAGRSTAASQPRKLASDVLFWSFEEKVEGFANMEKHFPSRSIPRGEKVAPLAVAETPLEVSFDVDGETWSLDDYMTKTKTAGLLVIKDGRILVEKYGLGLSSKGRWTSFSVAKSFSSTLVGAAIKDGAIGSIEDPITLYLPGLKGSAYEGVTIRHVLNMTSGAKWNEDYTDAKSDVSRFIAEPSVDGSDPTVSYMARLKREAEPGTKWLYKTGETNLVGSLVTAATGKSLSQYLSDKVWSKFGMEQDAAWLLNPGGYEIAGCCVSASLRDYGRFGVFFMNGAKVDGQAIVPEGWIADATRSTEPALAATRGGYGFQWWTTPGAVYWARGIFGQSIAINPDHGLVVVTLSAWDNAVDRDHSRWRRLMRQAVENAVGG